VIDLPCELAANAHISSSSCRGMPTFRRSSTSTTFHRHAGLRLLGVVTLALLQHDFTCAAEVSQTPVLRIEAGTHLGQIQGVAADSTGRYAVSASEDKTARVWDVRSGRLLTVLRVPSSSGRVGRLNAVAMTPDGETIAVAANMEVSTVAPSVYIFDRSSGRVVRRLAGLPSTLGKLAFDPGGHWLAMSLLGGGSTGGLRVWDWRKQGATPAVLASEGLKEGALGIGWSADGRLAASSLDGQMRLYRIDAERLVKVAQASTPGGPLAPEVSFSPDGKEIAVGYLSTMRVDILSGDDLSLRHTPIQGPTKEGIAISSVAWSADGKTLLAGGNLGGQKIKLIRHWSNAGRGAAADFTIEGDTLQGLRSLPDGSLLVASGASLGVLSATGVWRPFRPRANADFRNAHTWFGLNQSGSDVQFTFDPFGSRFSFALTGRSVVPAKSDQFTLPRTTGPADRDMLKGIESSIVIGSFAGQIRRGNLHGLALAPHMAGIALGISESLHYLDANGKRIWKLPASAEVWAVNIPPKGNIVVAAHGDGTIHWHRLSDGAELLALFPHADRKRWVLWTPSGYYDASPGAEDLIGWHVNRGVNQAADFFPVSQFRERFNRPDVIDLVLDTLDEGVALAQANAAASRREAAVSVTQVLPPVVDAVSIPERFADTSLTVRIRVRAPADAPSIRLRVLVDGAIMPTAKAARAVGTDGIEALTLILPPKDSEVEIYADNRHGTSLPLTFSLQWVGDRKLFAAGEQGDRKTAKPKLWLLAVGVSAYRDAGVPSLSYAHLDAEDFAKTLQVQQGKAYREVAVRLLTQAAATRASVLAGLDWLKANLAVGDVGVVFLSGHGFTMATDKRYYYGASDVDLRRLVDTGVAYKDIQDALVEFNLRGGGTRAVLFIDTCHAGDATGAGITGAVKASNGDAMATELSRQENQVLVFASSRGDQVSWEDPRYGHGAFTKALIEGLGEEFRADLTGQNRVTYKGLDTWVSARVPILTQNRQTPRLMTPPGGLDDFPLATK